MKQIEKIFNKKTYFNEFSYNEFFDESKIKKLILLFITCNNRFTKELVEEIKEAKNRFEWLNVQQKIFKEYYEEYFEIINAVYQFYYKHENNYKFYLKHSSFTNLLEETIDITNTKEIEEYKKSKVIIDNLFHKVILFMLGKLDKIFITSNEFNYLQVYLHIEDKKIARMKQIIENSEIFTDKLLNQNLNFETIYVLDKNIEENKKEKIINYNKEVGLNNRKVPKITEEFIEFVKTIDFEPSYRGLTEKLKELGFIDPNISYNAIYVAAKRRGLNDELSKVIKSKAK